MQINQWHVPRVWSCSWKFWICNDNVHNFWMGWNTFFVRKWKSLRFINVSNVSVRTFKQKFEAMGSIQNINTRTLEWWMKELKLEFWVKSVWVQQCLRTVTQLTAISLKSVRKKLKSSFPYEYIRQNYVMMIRQTNSVLWNNDWITWSWPFKQNCRYKANKNPHIVWKGHT